MTCLTVKSRISSRSTSDQAALTMSRAKSRPPPSERPARTAARNSHSFGAGVETPIISVRLALGIQVVLDGDAPGDQAGVVVVADAEDLLEHVLVILTQGRRPAVPPERDASERVAEIGKGADVACREGSDPLPGH